MLTRRQILRGGGAGLLAVGTGLHRPHLAWAQAPSVPLAEGLPAGVGGIATLEALPGKRPLIKLTYRPPNYETPVEYFAEDFTPNDAFFVRYHLSDIPEVDAAQWRLRVAGGNSPLDLSLDQLRGEFEPVEIAAVCMCSGNRRGLFSPHVAGVQWGYGAMGNARWRGARLKDVLARAGARPETLEVVFGGADGPAIEATPDFSKSIPFWKAQQEDTLVAYEMNGAPLPHWNGFPARLVVPGWTATYWVKHLTAIELSGKPYDGFWMKSAYRIPRFAFPLVQRFTSQDAETTTPITEMMVNSLVTSPAQGQSVPAGQPVEVRGIAWDGGYGIQSVEVSSDDGKTWQPAELGADNGRYAFRPWRMRLTLKPGAHVLRVRASNRVGQTQTSDLIANPAGYHHNLMPRIEIRAA